MYEQNLNYHIQLAAYEDEKLQELQARFQDPRSHGPNNFLLKCLKEKIQRPKNEIYSPTEWDGKSTDAVTRQAQFRPLGHPHQPAL